MDVRVGKPRLEALTGLRYIAALCILLFHLTWHLPFGQFKQYALSLWGIGMPLFFTLSGFLMAYNYSAGFQTQYRSMLGKYLLARFARIYPIYLIGLLIWLGTMGHVSQDFRENARDTAVSLAMNATMTQNWAYVPLYAYTASPRAASYAHYWIAWSVSVECFFYLMFPLIVWPVARYVTNPRRAVLAAGSIFLGYLAIDFVLMKAAREPVLISLSSVWVFVHNPYIRFGEFLIGVMAGQAFLHSARQPITARGWWCGVAVLATTIPMMFVANHWIWSAANDTVFSRVAASNVLFAPLCAAIVYCLARIPSALQRLLGSRPMVLLGESSYCLYLIHPVVFVLFAARLQGEGELQLRRIIVFNHVMMLVVLHFLCFGLYRYAEVPLRSFVKRLFDRRQPVISPMIERKRVAA